MIAVGGYDDGNDPERKRLALYCSSFGVTADGLVKPEIIAPAMWVAAPILPRHAGLRAGRGPGAARRRRRTTGSRPRIREVGPETIGLPPSDWPGPDALRAWIDGSDPTASTIGARCYDPGA